MIRPIDGASLHVSVPTFSPLCACAEEDATRAKISATAANAERE
jgi:hypothetical protein